MTMKEIIAVHMHVFSEIEIVDLNPLSSNQHSH